MKTIIKDNKSTSLVRSKFFKRGWIENSKNQRISFKFKIYKIKECGVYTYVRTNKGVYIYHRNVDELIFKGDSQCTYIEKLSEHLYCVSWYDDVYEWFYRLYDDKGNLLKMFISGVSELQNGLIAFKQNELWGFLDETGKVVIPPAWHSVEDFNKYDYSIVSFKGGKRKAVIDKKGSYILKPSSYYEIEFLNEEYIRVNDDSGTGVITLKGKIVIPTVYTNVTLKSGFFLVRYCKKYGLFNLNGEKVFDCIYPEIIETPDKFVVQDFTRKEIQKYKEVNK